MHKVKLIMHHDKDTFERELAEFLNDEDIREDKKEICLISYSYGSQVWGGTTQQPPQQQYYGTPQYGSPQYGTPQPTYQPPPTFQINNQPIYSALVVLRDV
jgi:hypothetical protein